MSKPSVSACISTGRSVWSGLRYEVNRAARQYHAVEPENRLVARTLERQWEEALASEEQLKADHRRFLAAQPVMLSDERTRGHSPPRE